MWFFSGKKDAANRYKRRPPARPARRSTPAHTVYARAAERRNSQLHKAGAVALMLAALAGAGWALLQGGAMMHRWLFSGNEQFVIRRVDVATSGRLTAEHVKEYGGFREGGNLFDLDINAVRKRLEEVPVIRDVEVQRRLPSTLVVRVNERVPLARIAHGQAGFFFAVDRDGHVLGLAGPMMRSLPVITGFSDRGVTPGSVLGDTVAADALRLIALCDSSPLGEVIRMQSIDVGNPDYLNVALDNGVKVFMPRHASRAKLEDLAAILREAGGRRSFIDLTLDRNIPTT